MKNNHEYLRKYFRDRLKNNIQARLAARLRGRFGTVLRSHLKGTRKTSSVRDLGCTLGELCAHLEGMFVAGMNWANYGRWHIDHVKPLASFDLTSEEQQREACHFTNLQPLWARDNIAKRDRILN